MDAIQLEQRFLKCDAAGCDHREEVPEFSESDIGKPCPKCGANLLTKEDYDTMRLYEAISHAVNAVIGPVDPDTPMERVSFNPHAGDVHLTIFGPERQR